MRRFLLQVRCFVFRQSNDYGHGERIHVKAGLSTFGKPEMSDQFISIFRMGTP
jgi:hypothetical protein